MRTKEDPGANDKSSNAQADGAASWMLILRGAAAILFGVLAVAWPGLTLILFVAMFAAYALVGGFASVVAAFARRRSDRQWWLPLMLGIVSVAAGVYALVYPALSALVLVLVMGFNAVLTGALDIALAIRLRRVLRGRWPLVLSGIVSLLFGALVLAAPGPGALAMVWLISLHAVVTGVLLLSLGLRIRRAAHDHAPQQPLAAGGH
ncbi:HdeD family acid-resistance protein [Variovorax sp. RA8]|uniref:HdeD family acid-resistance protein n=1 Tax=Variovorax sp. (strain JCM 16519 / RA8) TaxID=662548 RepID=UPI0013172086|nr:HdeD family acid-resistance protein [Variovorax sp. RA8]VTU16493.1 hypothetical protein RA8CHR_01282 [Variovorax sp. RA8]